MFATGALKMTTIKIDIRRTFASVPERKKRRPQGTKRGKYEIGIETGLFLDNSHFGTFFHIPGMACGMQDQGEMIPALPILVP